MALLQAALQNLHVSSTASVPFPNCFCLTLILTALHRVISPNRLRSRRPTGLIEPEQRPSPSSRQPSTNFPPLITPQSPHPRSDSPTAVGLWQRPVHHSEFAVLSVGHDSQVYFVQHIPNSEFTTPESRVQVTILPREDEDKGRDHRSLERH